MERRGRWREGGGPLLGFLLMAYQRPKLLHLRKWLILKTENWGSYRNEKIVIPQFSLESSCTKLAEASASTS